MPVKKTTKKNKPKKAKAGRPSKLTPQVCKMICRYVKEGNTYRVAALCSGIGEDTFRRWKNSGRKAKSGLFKEFWDDLQEAEAQALKAKVKTMKMAAEGYTETKTVVKQGLNAEGKLVTFEKIITKIKKLDWIAAATFLERRDPNNWGKFQSQEVPEDKEETPREITYGFVDDFGDDFEGNKKP